MGRLRNCQVEIVEEVKPDEVSVSDFATPYDNGDGLWNVSIQYALLVIFFNLCRANAHSRSVVKGIK